MARPANPQEQKAYGEMVKMALGFMFDEKNAATLKKMASAGDPSDAIASMAVMVLKQMMESAKLAGKDMTQYVQGVGKEIIGHMVDMLITFKVIPEAQAPQAMQSALQQFAEITGGKK